MDVFSLDMSARFWLGLQADYNIEEEQNTDYRTVVTAGRPESSC